MRCTGAKIILQCLKEQGVDTIFGYPGGTVLNIYDELYSYKDINCILTSHEQGASHAADGYARATGKVGVCIATSGPGATNLVTGIATAYMDSVPLVAITGQVSRNLIGKKAFQEVDIVSITKTITKRNFLVKDIRDLAKTLRLAFKIAKGGRPGPVLVDIPKDITAEEFEYTEEFLEETTSIRIDEAEMKRALEIINLSKKPMIIIGGGCNISECHDELLEFQDKLKSPVCSTMMGLGAFQGKHKMYTGLIGMHGTVASNKVMTNCDTIIAIGARFNDRVIGNSKSVKDHIKVVHIDIDKNEISKNIEADSYIIGDAKNILKNLNNKLNTREEDEWSKFILGLIAKDCEKKIDLSNKLGVNPIYVVKKLYELTKGEAIVSTEVGQNQIWTTQGYTFTKPRTFISSGGLGTMGYGLGAAIGASVGTEKTVFNIAGDGSFRMNCNELATLARYNLPVKVIILNNNVLGMVRQWQNLFYNKRYSHTTLERETNFVKISEGYGVLGFNIKSNDEVEEILLKAINHKGPVVVDCFINEDFMAVPIVPPGALIEEMLHS
ncbi:MAG: biosynthetic-type acetolactate synthase large subunit [Clostridium perfringens]|nr:biosynthetic-type acetolactate synthase large subunit [Clostridium perfringens]